MSESIKEEKKEEKSTASTKATFGEGALAYKVGMTSLYDAQGKCVCVTLLHVADNVIVGYRTHEKHGYNAVQLGVGLKKKELLNKPMSGFYAQLKIEPRSFVREFRVDALPSLNVGSVVGVHGFEVGQNVSVTGISKGKGFQGVIKRHGFHGGPATRGSRFHRTTGSIGMRARPGKVYKGRKMPGRMGGEWVTTSHLKIVDIDIPGNIVAVMGSVPGAYQSLVEVRKEQ